MPDYRVELDSYHGPLDLLLFLVRRHEIDLNDIPIAELTDQYLEYLRHIQRIDMDLAGEFLVMAAMLLEIKSQMLLPPPERAEGAAGEGLDELDPRFELVQQLLAYKAYKDAALQLDGWREQWEQRFAHVPARLRDAARDGDDVADDSGDAELVEFDLEDADVMDLCGAFSRILESIGHGPTRHEVVYDDTPIGLHAEDILDRLQRLEAGQALTLTEVFLGRKTRGEVIGLFLATLELVNQKKVSVKQDRIKGEILLMLRNERERATADAAAPDWRNPQTGEVDYDWPSEGIRRRFEQRQARRSQRLASGQFGDVDDDQDAALDVDDEPDADRTDNPGGHSAEAADPEPSGSSEQA